MDGGFERDLAGHDPGMDCCHEQKSVLDSALLPGERKVCGLRLDAEVFASELELHPTVVVGDVPAFPARSDRGFEAGFPGGAQSGFRTIVRTNLVSQAVAGNRMLSQISVLKRV